MKQEMKCRIARLMAVLVLGLCGPAWAAAPKETIAQLGGTQLTAAEARNYFQTLDPQTRRQAMADPQLMNRLIQLEVIRKAILKEAILKKWQQRPEISKQIDTASNAILVKTYLASVVRVPGSYPSDQDIRATYELNRDQFLVPRQYRLAQIFIASAAGDKNAPAARKKIDQLAVQARAGKFEELARKNSQHKTSADKGGDMGWLADSQILPEVRTRIAGMLRGGVSEPFRTPQGWHIVRLLDTKPAGMRPLSEVKDAISASLRQKREQEEQQRYIVRMLQKTPVTVNEAHLRNAVADAR